MSDTTTSINRFRHREALRVRWAEVDMQKIVFNGHYLMYADTAMAGYWRALVLPYEETMQQLGGDLFVRKATLEYQAPAHYDDMLTVGVRTRHIGNSSIVFDVGVYRSAQCLVHGELVYVFADPVARVAQPLPPALRTVLTQFEAGQPMVRVQVGRWTELGEAARQIREEVFIREQQIPADMERDEADAGCVHAVAYNLLGAVVGTGRLLAHAPGVAKIGRMAVRQAVRGSGVGRALLASLLQAAQDRGDHEVMLHAQHSAVAFYRSAGFSSRGPEFEEAGIVHMEMVRRVA